MPASSAVATSKKTTVSPVASSPVAASSGTAAVRSSARAAAKRTSDSSSVATKGGAKHERKPRSQSKLAAPTSVSTTVPSGNPTVDPVPSTTTDDFGKRKRVMRPPVSPRAASKPFVTSGGEFNDMEQLRDTANNLSRSIRRFSRIAQGVAKSDKGEFKCNGVLYNKKDISEMEKSLSGGVKKLPSAVVATSKKKKVSEEKIAARKEALIERARLAAANLSKNLKIPQLENVLLTNEMARIEESPPSKARGGMPTQSPVFFMSDQFREFIRHADLGNGIARLFPHVSDKTASMSGASDPDAAIAAVDKELGQSCVKLLGVTHEKARLLADPRRVLAPVIEHGIMTSPLLMSLMTRYIKVNNLKDEETNRILLDENLRRLDKSNTRLIVNGKDYTPADADADLLSKSGLERLALRSPKDENGPIPFDGKTFTRNMQIVLASMYRVPPTTDKQKEFASNPVIRNIVTALNMYIRRCVV